MAKSKENREVEGEILEVLPNTMFKVKLVEGAEIIGVPSGKMRRGFMRLLPGSLVIVEMTPYDEARGRIVAARGRR